MKKLEIENDGIQNEKNESSTYIYMLKFGIQSQGFNLGKYFRNKKEEIEFQNLTKAFQESHLEKNQWNLTIENCKVYK